MSKKQSVKRSGPQQLFYTEAFKQKIGIGFEYFRRLDSFKDILAGNLHEHLIGPTVDINSHPMRQVQGGS